MKKVKSLLSIFLLLASITLLTSFFNYSFVVMNKAIANIKNNKKFLVTSENIDIKGLNRLKRNEVLIIAGLDHDKMFFEIKESQIELYIKSNRWVKNCIVKKSLPNNIKIMIKEYDPVMLINTETEIYGSQNNFTVWFVDRDATVFKKAFPKENKDYLPFFFIDTKSVSKDKRDKVIHSAIQIIDEWKSGINTCILRAVHYDITDGYSIDCEFDTKRMSKVYIGFFKKKENLTKKRLKFFDVAVKFKKKHQWAKKYFFEESGGKIKLAIEHLVKLNED